MKRKSVLRIVVALTFIMSVMTAGFTVNATTETSSSNDEIIIVVNGITLEQSGIIQNRRLLVSFNAIAEALGETTSSTNQSAGEDALFVTVRDAVERFDACVVWDSITQTLTITGRFFT